MNFKLPNYEEIEAIADDMEECGLKYNFLPLKETIYEDGKYKIYLEKTNTFDEVRLKFECCLRAEGVVCQELYNVIVESIKIVEKKMCKMEDDENE